MALQFNRESNQSIHSHLLSTISFMKLSVANLGLPKFVLKEINNSGQIINSMKNQLSKYMI